MEYTVTWTIEVDGESAEDAVLQASGIMHDFDSEATCFQVIPTKDIVSGTWKMIDIDELTK